MKFTSTIKKMLLVATFVLIFAATYALDAEAGQTLYKNGDKSLNFGAQVQVQYNTSETPGHNKRDDLKFRRLRPNLSGTLTKNLSGKFELDTGDSGTSYDIKYQSVYLKYTGIKDITIILGNTDFNFSRELLTSSKKQQLVERTFVGDHNYGTPDKTPGLHVKGSLLGKKLTYGLSAASSSIDPDDDKLDFDTPLNEDSDFNRGFAFGARVDLHPQGYLPLSQGDFTREFKTTLGLGAFSWKEDKDHRSYSSAGLDKGSADSTDPGRDRADIESVKGFELSGALRGRGISIDAQYNRFEVETVDATYSRGIFRSGETTLKNFAVEGGYMVIPEKLEIVAGYQVQDADSYANKWKRRSIGANYYINKHNMKLQATLREGRELDGVKNKDKDEVFLQAQYLF